MSSRFLSLQCLASELEDQQSQPYSRQPPPPVTKDFGQPPVQVQVQMQPPVQVQVQVSQSLASSVAAMGRQQGDGRQQLPPSERDPVVLGEEFTEDLSRKHRLIACDRSSKQDNSFHGLCSDEDSGDILDPTYSNEVGKMMLRSPGSSSTKSSVSQESGVASGSEEEEGVKVKEENNLEREGMMNSSSKISDTEGGKYNLRSEERLICQRWWGKAEDPEVGSKNIITMARNCMISQTHTDKNTNHDL